MMVLHSQTCLPFMRMLFLPSVLSYQRYWNGKKVSYCFGQGELFLHLCWSFRCHAVENIVEKCLRIKRNSVLRLGLWSVHEWQETLRIMWHVFCLHKHTHKRSVIPWLTPFLYQITTWPPTIDHSPLTTHTNQYKKRFIITRASCFAKKTWKQNIFS